MFGVKIHYAYLSAVSRFSRSTIKVLSYSAPCRCIKRRTEFGSARYNICPWLGVVMYANSFREVCLPSTERAFVGQICVLKYDCI